MRPPITFDDWNVKYFISQASNKENMRNDSVRLSLSGEKVEWNSKARSRRSDKQSWNTSKATNQNSARSFDRSFVRSMMMMGGPSCAVAPFSSIAGVLAFIDLLMEHTKNEEEEEGKQNILFLLTHLTSRFMYRKEHF